MLLDIQLNSFFSVSKYTHPDSKCTPSRCGCSQSYVDQVPETLWDFTFVLIPSLWLCRSHFKLIRWPFDAICVIPIEYAALAKPNLTTFNMRGNVSTFQAIIYKTCWIGRISNAVNHLVKYVVIPAIMQTHSTSLFMLAKEFHNQKINQVMIFL